MVLSGFEFSLKKIICPSVRCKKSASENVFIQPGNWLGRISSITLKPSTTGPAAAATWAASLQRPLTGSVREDCVCLWFRGQSICADFGVEMDIDFLLIKDGCSALHSSSALWIAAIFSFCGSPIRRAALYHTRSAKGNLRRTVWHITDIQLSH